MSAFTDKLVTICSEEYIRWDNGKGRETEGRDQAGISKDYYLFVKEYWQSLGKQNLDGRTVVDGIRPAWSAAFVSYCVRMAGGGNRFKYAEAHCHYIAAAMTAQTAPASTYGYHAKRYENYKPKLGDIICAGREYAKAYNFEQAEMVYATDSFYPSHGDIVVDLTTTHAITIGGNIIHNVDRKRLPLDDSGILLPRIDKGKQYPWITVLSCMM